MIRLREDVDGTIYDITRASTNQIVWDSTGEGNFISVRACGPPKLSSIRQKTGDVIRIGDDSVSHFAPGGATPTRSVYFRRDNQGRITELRDPLSGTNGWPVVKYVYNRETGNLIQVLKLTDRAVGSYVTNKYHYDNPKFPHYITSIDSPLGVPVARNEYDDAGRLTAVVDADGNRTEIHHDTGNRVEVVIDRLGRTNSHAFDAKGNVIASTNALGEYTLSSYDTNNNLLSTTDSLGHTTSYTFDDQGNQTSIADALGHTNWMTYDNAGRLLSRTDPVGNVMRNSFDDFGNLTNTMQISSNHVIGQSFSRYENGLLVETRDASGRTNAMFSYDGAGNVSSSTDAKGFARNFGYDANGSQTSSSYTWSGGGTTTNVTTSSEFDAQGRSIRSIDAFGKTNLTVYNAIGKADYTVDRLGNTNRFFYDSRGNQVQTIGVDGLATKTVYNEDGKPIYTTDRNDVSGTRTDYDGAGRITNSVRFTNMVISVSALSPGVWASALVTEGTPFATNSTEYFANGWVKARCGPDRQWTTYEYWDDGQTKTVTDPLTNVTFYAFDPAGRQDYVADALNHTNRFTHDAAGRVTRTTFADGTFITSIFNTLGNQIGKVDQGGILTSNVFDVSGQLTAVVTPGPETGGGIVPPAGPPAGATWTYGFDQYGRQTNMVDAAGHVTTNGFDQFGFQFMTRLPGLQTNWVKRDDFGRVSEVWDFKGQHKLIRYDWLGREATNFWFAAGALWPSNSLEYHFDHLGRYTNITERSGPDASSTYAAASPRGPPNRYYALLNKVPQEAQGAMSGLLLFASVILPLSLVRLRRNSCAFAMV